MYHSIIGHDSIKVKDNLYCYIWQGMGNNCNSCLFTNVLKGDKPHVIIDPGHIFNEFDQNCFDSLSKTIAKDGYSVDDIGLVINTHSHTDHSQANMMLAKNGSTDIAMSEEEEKFRNTLGKRLDEMFGIDSPKYTTNIFLKEGDLELGEKNKLKLQVLITPGHSPGSVCLYLPDSKILITGDVIFYASVGRTDFPGGDTLQLKNSIERLSKLDVEYLIPGHCTEMGGIIADKKDIERNFKAVRMIF